MHVIARPNKTFFSLTLFFDRQLDSELLEALDSLKIQPSVIQNASHCKSHDKAKLIKMQNKIRAKKSLQSST